jgi:hypothetical protein
LIEEVLDTILANLNEISVKVDALNVRIEKLLGILGIPYSPSLRLTPAV